MRLQLRDKRIILSSVDGKLNCDMCCILIPTCSPIMTEEEPEASLRFLSYHKSSDVTRKKSVSVLFKGGIRKRSTWINKFLIGS